MHSLIHPNRQEDMVRKKDPIQVKNHKNDDYHAPVGSSSSVRPKRTYIAWN